jgi:hypothetical protein
MVTRIIVIVGLTPIPSGVDIEAPPVLPPYYSRHSILQYRSGARRLGSDQSCLNYNILGRRSRVQLLNRDTAAIVDFSCGAEGRLTGAEDFVFVKNRQSGGPPM